MTHLGYGSYFCQSCKDLTNHRLVEAKADGTTFVLKLCMVCKPPAPPKLTSVREEVVKS